MLLLFLLFLLSSGVCSDLRRGGARRRRRSSINFCGRGQAGPPPIPLLLRRLPVAPLSAVAPASSTSASSASSIERGAPVVSADPHGANTSRRGQPPVGDPSVLVELSGDARPIDSVRKGMSSARGPQPPRGLESDALEPRCVDQTQSSCAGCDSHKGLVKVDALGAPARLESFLNSFEN